MRARYCSIYEDCWVIEGAQKPPARVAECPTDWPPFGNQ